METGTVVPLPDLSAGTGWVRIELDEKVQSWGGSILLVVMALLCGEAEVVDSERERQKQIPRSPPPN
jgi:hypothetical protein